MPPSRERERLLHADLAGTLPVPSVLDGFVAADLHRGDLGHAISLAELCGGLLDEFVVEKTAARLSNKLVQQGAQTNELENGVGQLPAVEAARLATRARRWRRRIGDTGE